MSPHDWKLQKAKLTGLNYLFRGEHITKLKLHLTSRSSQSVRFGGEGAFSRSKQHLTEAGP